METTKEEKGKKIAAGFIIIFFILTFANMYIGAPFWIIGGIFMAISDTLPGLDIFTIPILVVTYISAVIYSIYDVFN